MNVLPLVHTPPTRRSILYLQGDLRPREGRGFPSPCHQGELALASPSCGSEATALPPDSAVFGPGSFLVLVVFQGRFTMGSETSSTCPGELLLALAITAVVTKVLPCLPCGQVLEPAKITDMVWFFHGFLGAGLLGRMRLSYLASSKSPNNHLILGPLSLGPQMWLALSLCSPQHTTHRHSAHSTASMYFCAPPWGCEPLKDTAQSHSPLPSKPLPGKVLPLTRV